MYFLNLCTWPPFKMWPPTSASCACAEIRPCMSQKSTSGDLKKIQRATISSKIIRALEIIRIRKLTPNAFFEINICQALIFRRYTVCNKLKMIKIDNQTREKSQVLSQVLE